MSLEVKLQAFEGPLDLLLHLIEKNKVDIYDIPIVEITQQYMDTIRQMESEDLNVMSEFLVMAATLLDIKCRMLLPGETDEDGEEEDPRDELVRRLLEYKAYKYMSYELKDMQMDAGKAFYREPSLPEEVLSYRAPVDYDELLGDTSLVKLQEIFRSCLRRQEQKVDPVRSRFGRIEKDEVNIERKAKQVTDYIRTHERMNFRELLEKGGSRMEVIVTFLVVLELMKTGMVCVEQESIESDIIITTREKDSGQFDSLQLTSLDEGQEGKKAQRAGETREAEEMEETEGEEHTDGA